MGDTIFYAFVVGSLAAIAAALWHSWRVERGCYAKIDELNRKLDEATRERVKLFKEIDGYAESKLEREKLRNILQEREVKIQGMWERIGNADRHCEELSNEVAALKSENKKLRTDLDSSRESCGNAMDKFNKAVADFKALEKTHQQTVEALRRAEKMVEEWKGDCVRHRKAFDATEANYKRDASHLCREVERYRADAKNLKKEADSLRRELAVVQRDLATLANRMSVIRQYAVDVDPVLEVGPGKSPVDSSLALTSGAEHLNCTSV